MFGGLGFLFWQKFSQIVPNGTPEVWPAAGSRPARPVYFLLVIQSKSKQPGALAEGSHPGGNSCLRH